MLDRPESPLDDPEVAAALRARGRAITTQATAITVALTIAFWLLAP